jgi:hypothetical protein
MLSFVAEAFFPPSLLATRSFLATFETSPSAARFRDWAAFVVEAVVDFDLFRSIVSEAAAFARVTRVVATFSSFSLFAIRRVAGR